MIKTPREWAIIEYGMQLSLVQRMILHGENYDSNLMLTQGQIQDRAKRHAKFFKGLSPREEYAKHAEFRKTIDEF